MAHFFITDNTSAKEYANDTFSDMPNTTISESRLSSESTIVYDDRRASHIQLDDAEVWGFGTFFSKKGFHADALESIDDLDGLLDLLQHRLRGHYVFVVSTKSGVRVIPDKIGLLNVYYSNSDHRYISTDPALVSICASNTTLAEQETKEFILNESTVGDKTIFVGTKRLGFGQEIKLTDNSLGVDQIHTYTVEDLSFEEHTRRIENYFKQINTFNGAIGTDISAGFDTRTVAAVGHTTIDGLGGNTNPNPNDGGADEALSPRIADKLSIRLTHVDFEENYEGNDMYMIHGTALGRDIKRSFRWPNKMEKKYSQFDLILGGYGGETLRGKYNDRSIPQYYSEDQAEKLFSDSEYNDRLLRKTSAYPSINTSDQLMNLIYTIDRMRIWGGSSVTMSSIYGDILHPFMDWHLINPIFSLSSRYLKDGKYQRQIIERFAPQLEGLPINATSQIDYRYRRGKKKLKKNIKRSKLLTSIAKRALSLIGSTTDEQLNSAVSNSKFGGINEELAADTNIDMNVLQNSAGSRVISRAYAVSTIHTYVKKKESNRESR